MTIPIHTPDSFRVAAMPHVEIGEIVKRFREATGYSIEDLALTCGLTDVEISRIETGEDVDPVRLKRIANALQMPASTFESH